MFRLGLPATCLSKSSELNPGASGLEYDERSVSTPIAMWGPDQELHKRDEIREFVDKSIRIDEISKSSCDF